MNIINYFKKFLQEKFYFFAKKPHILIIQIKDFVVSNKNLTKWRKKIKNWLKNIGNTEKSSIFKKNLLT